MEKVYDNNGMIVHYDNSIFIQSFSEKTEDWEDEEYKEEFKIYASLIEKYKPLYILVDTRKFLFSVIPELQEWQIKVIRPSFINVGVKKAAMLMSEDFFSQISIEQTLEEDEENHTWQTQFFENKNDAMEWLMRGR